jgi:hypothetical protein
MKEKIYSVTVDAMDKNGKMHTVVMVGVYTQFKTEEIVKKTLQVPVDENKCVDGTLSYFKPKMKRRLRYAFSICHPNDKFNEEYGKKLAIKRAKTKPLGELETSLITTLCKDQINLILLGEAHYIAKNIEKFIK